MIPHDIHLYDDHYRLWGATAYIDPRRHYISYIWLDDGRVLYYDGLPEDNPILRLNSSETIEGLISLLVYFPIEMKQQLEPVCIPVMKPSCLRSVNEEEASSSKCCGNIDEEEDALLAEALREIDRND